MTEVRPVRSRAEMRTFIHLPWRLYRGDPRWVPPMLREMWETMTSPHNPLLKAGPHVALLAWQGGAACGRVLCGVNAELNRAKQTSLGWFSLFESCRDPAAARALMGAAEAWLRTHGATVARGPMSPTQGDDYRGMLVEGFDQPPMLMDTYNPDWYPDLLANCGYAKEFDLWAFRYDAGRLPERLEKVSAYAMQRYGFRADGLRMHDLEADMRDIKQILDRAMPDDWVDLAPPSLADISDMARRLRPLADPDLCVIARTAAGEPIGFCVGLPNYAEVMQHMNGRLFPLGWLQFLLRRRRIRGARIFVLFVVPEWRKKAVTGAIFAHTMRAARQRGYTWGEGSTIGEGNSPMIREAEGAGGLHYKTFRVFRKELVRA